MKRYIRIFPIVIILVVISIIVTIYVSISYKSVKNQDYRDNTLVENYTLNVENIIELNEIENVYMEIKDGTLTRTGTTIIITDNNEIPYSYSESFRIDKKINNKWESLDYMDQYKGGFITIAYNVNENSKLELNVDWTPYYGELENGIYRLVKNNYIDNEYKYFSVEFSIN